MINCERGCAAMIVQICMISYSSRRNKNNYSRIIRPHSSSVSSLKLSDYFLSDLIPIDDWTILLEFIVGWYDP